MSKIEEQIRTLGYTLVNYKYTNEKDNPKSFIDEEINADVVELNAHLAITWYDNGCKQVSLVNDIQSISTNPFGNGDIHDLINDVFNSWAPQVPNVNNLNHNA